MASTTCSVATNNIASLDDLPNDVGGLTAAQLKAMFDKFGTDFVAWFNATHIGTDKIHIGDNPAARVYHDANQSIANGAETVLAFNTEDYDTDAMHDTVTNNSRITINTAGKYLLVARIPWDTNGTGRRKTIFLKNGTTQIEDFSFQPVTSAGDTTKTVCSDTYSFVANDYIEIQVDQTSGGALNVLSGAAFTAVRVG